MSDYVLLQELNGFSVLMFTGELYYRIALFSVKYDALRYMEHLRWGDIRPESDR